MRTPGWLQDLQADADWDDRKSGLPSVYSSILDYGCDMQDTQDVRKSHEEE